MTSIISVVLGAFLGSLISFIAFHYKERKAEKEKLNQSLFRLLSVWQNLSMSQFIASDSYAEAIVAGLKRKYPNEAIPDNLAVEISKGIMEYVPIGKQSELYDKYHDSVESLAQIDPMLAFKLSSNRVLVEYLKILHDIPTESAEDQAFLSSFKSFTNKESLSDLEQDLLVVSKRVSRVTSKEVKQKIEKLRERVRNIPKSDIDEYINLVVVPVIEKAKQQANA
ncbi:hypothetical protein [Marinomonas sp. BSi20584]|uniref:hypothetical protein n=1 Tax=Marinomonas sp. BSi20584 TaxID=1594462 RepID=UPI000C1E1E30|nr:hypothetical protein [Marinomonas sp. BSi20584]PJE53534.1 hypothetical protein TY87_20250 [Marinomonas sp. BSi20584]